jgi:hypothetical protein
LPLKSCANFNRFYISQVIILHVYLRIKPKKQIFFFCFVLVFVLVFGIGLNQKMIFKPNIILKKIALYVQKLNQMTVFSINLNAKLTN